MTALLRHLFALCLALCCALGLARAAELRIEALDGGVVDLRGLTQIVAQQHSVAVVAEGASSAVNLSSLASVAARPGDPASTFAARTGGALTLHGARTTFVGPVTLELAPTGTVTLGALELGDGSLLTGSGTLGGALSNGGEVRPGGSGAAGTLNIGGAYTQTAQGQLSIELGGDTAGSGYDRLTSTAAATLDGALAVTLINNYSLVVGRRFDFLAASSRGGQFGSASGLTPGGGVNLSLEYSASGATLVAISGGPDTEGPTLSDVRYDGVPLTNGQTLTRAATLSLTASDPSGVSKIEFRLDNNLLGTLVGAGAAYSTFFNLNTVADGSHTLTLVAFDSPNNTTTLNYTVTVALEPPAVPTLTIPQDGLVTNQPTINVGGIATRGSDVLLYRNGSQINTLTADASGLFSGTANLELGENRFQAAARNLKGTSALSAPVTVTRNGDLPPGPTGLSAQGQAAGEIRLAWTAPGGITVAHYDIYRATAPFTDLNQASKVNSQPVTATRFDDLPAPDGRYYYRVVAFTSQGSQTATSNQADAISDSIPPRALVIAYAPAGPFDPASGRMGVGEVTVTVTTSEELLTAPFLSIVPYESEEPIAVALSRLTATTYQGTFAIAETTATGEANAVFSARDRVGNRGTDIDVGATLPIDTDGPVVDPLEVTPGDPIRNDPTNPVAVTVSARLNEPTRNNAPPILAYQLSGPGRGEQAIALTSTAQNTWTGGFTLPADAGGNGVEVLSFRYEGVDDLANVGQKIGSLSRFQIYQGNLPPLPAPLGLTARSQPAGRIQLQWQAVAQAADYQLYRQAPGESALTALRRSGGALTAIDDPGPDGLYRYAVASVRQANQQEAASGPSAAVEAVSDSVPPSPPLNLVLTLRPYGMEATWQAPADADPLRYRLYRATAAQITDVSGLTPLRADIEDLTVVDAAPSETEHAYAATAVDPAGNESAPSNSVYLNAGLLPVATLNVVQEDTQRPVVSWTPANSTVTGYDLYLGSGASQIKLNTTPLTVTGYTDTGYGGDQRLYTVVARDANNVESLGRSLLLPKLTATLQPGSVVQRGVLNRLEYRIENQSDQPLEKLTLRARVGAHDHQSAPFRLEALESRTIPIVVGGHADLANQSTLQTMVDSEPHAGERARIVRAGQIEVNNGALALSILTRNLTRGGTGQVRFDLENTSPVETGIVVARAAGSQASDQIRFALLDRDGNLLAARDFQQAFGALLETLDDGRVVARIPPGQRFESDWLDLPIPGAASEQATVQLTLDQLHYHLGRDDAVSIQGPVGRQPVTLGNTSYFCELLSINPQQSSGNEDIIMNGRSVERASGAPIGRVPLKLVVGGDGFERLFEVFTDGAGNFSYAYRPLPADSGVFRVSCIHPDSTERPEQGTFAIGRVIVKPTQFDLRIPRDFTQTMSVEVSTSAGAAATNVHLEFLGQDQPAGSLPPGIQVTPGSPLALAAGRSGTLSWTVRADSTAYASGVFFLRVVSAESGDTPLALIRINYAFSTAEPVLFYSPSFVEIGVAQEGAATARVTLENRGFAELKDVRAALLDRNGNPAPGWVSLASAPDLGVIVVGEQRSIDLVATPSASIAEGSYELMLRITASNHATVDIGVFVAVVRAGVGNVLFKLADIYTATLDANGQLIQGLAGAKIEIQNELVLTQLQTLTSDAAGEALFSNLPAGRYKYRVSALNHQPVIGRLRVDPGVTAREEVFLDYDLVTVEWSVTEIPLEDRYDIVLHATYQTNVPAPVVLIEPMVINLPDMAVGEVLNGQLNVTNYGLVRADDVQVTLPESDQYFKYEFMITNIPTSLGAKERFTIPYRLTKLAEIGPAGAGSGGGDCGYSKHLILRYIYECANGVIRSSGSGAGWYWLRGEDNCGFIPGGWWGGGGGGGGCCIYPGGEPIEGPPECVPECEQGNQCCEDPLADGPGGSGSGGNGSGGGGR